MQTRHLGRTDIQISPIGLGCMQFAGSGWLASRVFTPLDQDTVTSVVRTALDRGITWFDTAEFYGQGRSERALTTALRQCDVAAGEVAVATKWTPVGRTATHLLRSIDARLSALQGYPIDLYQIHLPLSFSTIAAEMRAMARLLRARRIRAVGVSNFSARQMAAAHAALAAEGIALASNQVQISLINRDIERNGVLDAARELGVTLIAYSPLASGVLTGRYHDDPAAVQSLPRLRRLTHRQLVGRDGLRRTADLIEAMRASADTHGATIAQVALNWLVTHYGDTVVAIPGASKPRQAAAAAGAMDFKLGDSELRRIDELSRELP